MNSTSSPAPADVQEGASKEMTKKENVQLSVTEEAVVDPRSVKIECRLEIQGQVGVV